MRAGARGYLLKGATQEEIVRAVHAVAAGEAIFGPGIARRVLQLLSGPGRSADPFPELTTRERQVLQLLAAGLSTTAVAERLGLATKTVTNHAVGGVREARRRAAGPRRCNAPAAPGSAAPL